MRTQRSLSDCLCSGCAKLFTRVFKKTARGNFDISCLELALKSVWPTKKLGVLSRSEKHTALYFFFPIVNEEEEKNRAGKKGLIKSIVKIVLFNAADAFFCIVLWLTLFSPVSLQGSKSTSRPNILYVASLLCLKN